MSNRLSEILGDPRQRHTLLTDDELIWLERRRSMTPHERELEDRVARQLAMVDQIDQALAVHGLSRENSPQLAATLDAVARVVASVVDHNARSTELVRATVLGELRGIEVLIAGEGQRIDQTEPMIEQAREDAQRTAKSLSDRLDQLEVSVAVVRASSRRNGLLLYGFIVFVVVAVVVVVVAVAFKVTGPEAATTSAIVLMLLARRLIGLP